MTNLKWTFVASLVSLSLGAAGGVLAAKGKGIVLTPDNALNFRPLDPRDKEGKGPQISVVFGDLMKKGPIGYLLKVPAGSISPAHMHTSDDYAVVIKGALNNYAPDAKGEALAPGGTWFQPANVAHVNHCEGSAPCEVFVYMPNGFDYVPATVGATPKK